MSGHLDVPPADKHARHSHFAGVYTIIAVIAGTLAIPYHDTAIAFDGSGAAILTGITLAVLLVVAILLVRAQQRNNMPQLRWMVRGYIALAASTLTLLPAWSALGLPSFALRSLCVSGYAGSLIVYVLDPQWRSTRRARFYRAATGSLAMSAILGAFLSGNDWPLGLLELLALSGALTLLLSNLHQPDATEAWSAAMVAILILAHVVDPFTAHIGTIPWVTHCATVGLIAIALAHAAWRRQP